MLNERVKNVLQYLAWLVFFLFLLYAGTVAVVAKAAKPYSQQKEKVAKLVKRTSMKQIDKYYHLSRGVKSYSASGKTSKGKAAYFIYLPGKHKPTIIQLVTASAKARSNPAFRSLTQKRPSRKST